jgi:hypothetical protein
MFEMKSNHRCNFASVAPNSIFFQVHNKMDEVTMNFSNASNYWRSKKGLQSFELMIKNHVDFVYVLQDEHRQRFSKLLFSLAFQSDDYINDSVRELVDKIAEDYNGKQRQRELYTKMTTTPIGDMPAVWVGEYDRASTEIQTSLNIHGGNYPSSRHSSYLTSVQKWRK